jgi:3-hydroxyisobutyrate dehydrogenase-like beta-hydroxyacid dehydrogenase
MGSKPTSAISSKSHQVLGERTDMVVAPEGPVGAGAMVDGCGAARRRSFERAFGSKLNQACEMETGRDKDVVGVIGLGLMGSALTERLLEHGCRVAVWNRTRSKADPLLARGADWEDNPLATCERVIISLYTTAVVEAVLAELDAGLHAGQILLDTTTGEPEQTAALGARLAARGVQYLDAPISGSSEQTRRGEATALEVMIGSNACSKAMDVKGRKLVERDYTAQARLSQHLKDVRLMLQAAADAGLSLPLADTHRRLMEQAEAARLGDQDNSAIIEVLRRPARQ